MAQIDFVLATLLVVIAATLDSTLGDISQKIVFERADLSYFNDAYAKDVKFDFTEKGNKFSVSASYELLKEVDVDKVTAFGKLYKKKGDVYEPQPMEIELNVCKEYMDQSLGKWRQAEKHGNITGCGIKKPGFYHIKDFVPEIPMKETVAIPEGSYKTDNFLKIGDVQLSHIEVYFRV